MWGKKVKTCLIREENRYEQEQEHGTNSNKKHKQKSNKNTSKISNRNTSKKATGRRTLSRIAMTVTRTATRTRARGWTEIIVQTRWGGHKEQRATTATENTVTIKDSYE